MVALSGEARRASLALLASAAQALSPAPRLITPSPLIAANGEPLLASEPYVSKQAARVGIEAVRRAAPGAAVVDETA